MMISGSVNASKPPCFHSREGAEVQGVGGKGDSQPGAMVPGALVPVSDLNSPEHSVV